MEKILLTDFNSERWNGVNMKNVKECFLDIEKRIKDDGCLFGELDHTYNFDISLKNVSHTIKNIDLVDGKIYGDIEILNTPKGKIVKTTNNKYRMGLRASGRTETKIKEGEQILSIWLLISKPII